MGSVIRALLLTLPSLLRSDTALRAEILALRHKVTVLQRQLGGRRVRLERTDWILWVWLLRLWGDWRNSLLIVQPETVLRWHRQGFRLHWRWKSCPRGPRRPRTSREIQELIRKMARGNPTWGAPRIRGELLMLGIRVSESTVSTYPPRRRKPPSQSWRTFLANHLQEAIAVDFAVVPTVAFQILFVFVVLSLERRKVLHLNVTSHPSAQWTAQQIVEACAWKQAPSYLIRDGIYGDTCRRRVASLGIAEIPIAPRSPWQNAYPERFIGRLRRECLDHALVLNERQCRRILSGYAQYYNRSRTHLALAKDAPEPRAVQGSELGEVIALPEVGGLHHRYERRAA